MAEIKRIVTPDPDGGPDRVQYVWRYRDADGAWRRAQAKTKKAMEAKRAKILARVESGQARGQRPVGTFEELSERWLEACEKGRDGDPPLDRVTLYKYRQQVRQHLYPLVAPLGGPRLGDRVLATITIPVLFEVREALLAKVSRDLARRVWNLLRSVMSFGVTVGALPYNPVGDMKIKADKRLKAARKAKRAADIPPPSVVKTILAAARARSEQSYTDETAAQTAKMYYVLFSLAAMSGLRESELFGLMEETDIDLKARTLTVNRRVDLFGYIGPCKSASSFRTVFLPRAAVVLLRDYLKKRKTITAKLKHDFEPDWKPGTLVFQSRAGTPLDASNVWRDAWKPIQEDAGIIGEGEAAKHDIHSLRHFYASNLIARGANPKEVQSAMGHASIQITFDTYGHLFPDEDGGRRKRADALGNDLVSGVA